MFFFFMWKGEWLFHLTEGRKIVEKEDSKECECEGYWKYISSGIECVIKNELETCPDDGYLLIVETKECFFGNECKDEYPLLFNKKGYANCPVNSQENPSYTNHCICDNFWQKNGKILQNF